MRSLDGEPRWNQGSEKWPAQGHLTNNWQSKAWSIYQEPENHFHLLFAPVRSLLSITPIRVSWPTTSELDNYVQDGFPQQLKAVGLELLGTQQLPLLSSMRWGHAHQGGADIRGRAMSGPVHVPLIGNQMWSFPPLTVIAPHYFFDALVPFCFVWWKWIYSSYLKPLEGTTVLSTWFRVGFHWKS